MDKMLFLDEKFFALTNFPEEDKEYCRTFSKRYPCDGNNEGAEGSGYCKCFERMEAIQFSLDMRLPIVNMEELPNKRNYWFDLNDPEKKPLIDGQIFDLPEGWEFKHPNNAFVFMVRKTVEVVGSQQELFQELCAKLSSGELHWTQADKFFTIQRKK